MPPEPTKTPQKDERYEGANASTIAIGRAKSAGWVLGAVLGLGAAASAFLWPKFGETLTSSRSKFRESISQIKVNLLGAERAARTDLGFVTGAGVVGWGLGNLIGMAYGFRRHLEKSNDGRAQFNRLKTERNMLAEQVDELEAENDDLHEKLGGYRHEHEAKKAGHVEAHLAKKEAAAPAEHARG